MKFRVVNIVSVLLLCGLLAVHLQIAPVRWWYFVLLGLGYTLIVFWGCVQLSMNFFIPIACRGNTEEKTVALTFDDGPNAAYSQQILDTLKMHNAPACFFCIGKHIKGNEAIVKRMMGDGHIIGNHSFSHDFWFDMYGRERMLADMKQTDDALTLAASVKPRLFRPPYGVMNPNLAGAIKKGNYTAVGWSIRSFDTAIKDKEKLLLRVLKQIKGGDIILLHDSMAITAEILPELIAGITARGFSIVRLDKMIKTNAYA